ncbi:unnamed protein product, partial [Ectocarpus fasciculatus]
MMASRPSDALGRRATLLYNNAFFIAGGLLCAVAVGSSGLFVGRFLAGMGVGWVVNRPATPLRFPFCLLFLFMCSVVLFDISEASSGVLGDCCCTLECWLCAVVRVKRRITESSCPPHRLGPMRSLSNCRETLILPRRCSGEPPLRHVPDTLLMSER